MTGAGLPDPLTAYSRWVDGCLRARWPGRLGPEELPIAAGLGRVTAGPVAARWPSPRFACAAMDGIAVVAGKAGCEPGPAGTAAGVTRLPAGSFAWVDTGDPLPAGMDAVVERERVSLTADGSAEFAGPVPAGRHVRPVGEDFPAGQLLIPGGHRLGPADLAAAAAAGHVTLRVARTPVVAIIPTGDEIRPVGSPLAYGEVADSNSLMLAARAVQAGARPRVSPVQRDDLGQLTQAVRRAARGADLVLVIAGSSVGRGDYTAAVLSQAGALVVRGVAVRPGHPVLLGYATDNHAASQGRAPDDARTVPVIGVPGYPLAAAVVFELFAVPLIAALQGRQPPEPVWLRAELACDWVSPPDAQEWVTVSLAVAAGCDDGRLLATPTGRGAGAISRLVRAHAWWPIPAGQTKFARGEVIGVRPIAGAD